MTKCVAAFLFVVCCLSISVSAQTAVSDNLLIVHQAGMPAGEGEVTVKMLQRDSNGVIKGEIYEDGQPTGEIIDLYRYLEDVGIDILKAVVDSLDAEDLPDFFSEVSINYLSAWPFESAKKMLKEFVIAESDLVSGLMDVTSKTLSYYRDWPSKSVTLTDPETGNILRFNVHLFQKAGKTGSYDYLGIEYAGTTSENI